MHYYLFFIMLIILQQVASFDWHMPFSGSLPRSVIIIAFVLLFALTKFFFTQRFHT